MGNPRSAKNDIPLILARAAMTITPIILMWHFRHVATGAMYSDIGPILLFSLPVGAFIAATLLAVPGLPTWLRVGIGFAYCCLLAGPLLELLGSMLRFGFVMI